MIRDEPFSLELLQAHRQSSHGSSCNGPLQLSPYPGSRSSFNVLVIWGGIRRRGSWGLPYSGLLPPAQFLVHESLEDRVGPLIVHLDFQEIQLEVF